MNNNFSKDQIDQILNMTSQKTGANAEDIKRGNIENVLSKLNPNQASQVKNLLNNPTLAKKLLNTPQARSLIEKLSKGR